MSMKDSRRVPDYLGHIVQAIERINRYVKDEDQAGFLRDEKTQDAVQLRQREGDAALLHRHGDYIPKFIAFSSWLSHDAVTSCGL